ncbi:MAG: DNA repair protein RecN [Rhodobacteraceae bacterium]|nr:DNA repair protein RecN [Paracoccaceae bacterium]
MLRHLEIRDLLLIERLEIDFRPGLNVLTGETGAGKSILLDALGLALGWAGRGDLLRPGASQAEVTATFLIGPDHPARDLLGAAGLPAADELVLRRVALAEGRRTAFANDRRITQETLRALAATLVELHGQHDDRSLLDPRGHRALLDAFAGTGTGVEAARAAWRDLAAARRELAAAEAARAAAGAEEEFLRHAVAELARLRPAAGEEGELDARRRAMQAAARVRDEIARAAALLSEEGAGRALADALRRLEAAAAGAGGRLEAPLAALGRALEDLAEAADGVGRCVEALEVDPLALERLEERLFALRAAARKHGVRPEELPGLAAALGARLALIEDGAAALAPRRAAVAAAAAAHAAAAAALGARRRAAAAALDAAMAAELPPLRLERARFATLVEPAAPGPEGSDAVSFSVATSPGAPPGPLERIASGGERARFMLALKVCLQAASPGRTLVFDEIDRGVGGATADAVGRRLAALGRGGQVLVVTHAPQVAARGGHHLLVAKEIAAGAARVRVTALDAAGRVDEIARMLAGAAVTEVARAAARALIAG